MGGLALLVHGTMDATAMRTGAMVVLVLALLSANGCTNAILQTLLAPESVVTGVGTELAQAGAQTLSGASLEELSDLGNTVEELDRILQENPDAVNADHLRGLRDQLTQGSGANTGPDQRQVMREPPGPRRPMDKKLPTRRGDRLAINPPGDHPQGRRPPARPDTLPSASALEADPTPVHSMSLKPVRLPR